MTKTWFRVLILCYIVTLLATTVEVFYFPALVSDELAAAYAREALPPFVSNPAIFLPLAAVSLAAIVVPPAGLFFLRKWGRWLGLWTTIAMLAVIPFFGPSLSSGFGTAMMQLSAILWGAVLTLAYFSSMGPEFR